MSVKTIASSNISGSVPALQFSTEFGPQTVAYTGTAGVSSAIANSTSSQYKEIVVRLVSSTDCFYLPGSDPTATTANGHFLPAGTIEYVQISGGEKISVIRSTTSGSLYISKMRS